MFAYSTGMLHEGARNSAVVERLNIMNICFGY
jgi:hypothetical protein